MKDPNSQTPVKRTKLRASSTWEVPNLKYQTSRPPRWSLKFGGSLVLGAWCLARPIVAQQYSIDWFKVSGGGGTSTNGQFAVSGTIGQEDAGGPMTGGNFSLTGGFWSLIAPVQASGAPLLSILLASTNTVVVSWPAPSTGFVLQQDASVGDTNWINSTNAVNVVGDQNQIIVSPPLGNRFYRLFHP